LLQTFKRLTWKHVLLSFPKKQLPLTSLCQKEFFTVARNVRRMEGALNRVAGYVALVNKPIDIPTVERLLKDILQEEALNQITIEKIQLKVAEYFQIRFEEMSSKKTFAARLLIALCKKSAMSSAEEITEPLFILVKL
jgi:chromosomal replication initiation ATPase DnaA